jgi:4-amino-4-deoxy-L-arabinose transferase-like glycosyltransferase
VRTLLRRNSRFFLLVTLAGLALRLLFLACCSRVTNDSQFYADIAKNWLQHGIYGLTDNGVIIPTLTRLPGYPAFLAVVFAIFGADHYRAVFVIQIFVDMATCLVIADIARRTISDRAAKTAFLLSALCPFLANYASVALTETLEVFFTALALDCAVTGLAALRNPSPSVTVPAPLFIPSLIPWIGCGAAIGAAILLRPDGGILLAALGFYLAIAIIRNWKRRQSAGSLICAGLIAASVACAVLAPWTFRNWHAFHRFQPLAPRYANEQDEGVPYGFNRWVKTWIAEYASVEEIYWPVPDEQIDPAKLPDRAFDSFEQKQATLDVIAAYNEDLAVSPEIDSQFANIAAERVRAHPVRYYIQLPLLRIADMWLRPRTELLPSDVRWWEFNDDPRGSILAVGFGLLNLFYITAALAGGWRLREIQYAGLLICFVVLRSVLLGTLENPEPRYTLESYPVVIVVASRLGSRFAPHR